EKSNGCYSNRGPVNKCFGNQVQRYYGDHANYRGAHSRKKCLNRAILTNFFNVMHTAENKDKRREKDEEGGKHCSSNSADEVAHECGEQHKRSRCCHAKRHAVQ